MNDLDDLDVLAARAAICCWKGKEGFYSQLMQRSDRLSIESLKGWLALWGLARSAPNRNRDRLLAFINDKAIPAYRNAKNVSSPAAYEIVEELSQLALENQVLSGRPTSLISKLGLAMLPDVFVPYDSTVRAALEQSGHRIRLHGYAKYMTLVLAEKPAFVRALDEKGLTAISLGATEQMSQSLFEMRALDKRLMLKGGFNPERMARELG